jgi:hypothetical protein
LRAEHQAQQQKELGHLAFVRLNSPDEITSPKPAER